MKRVLTSLFIVFFISGFVFAEMTAEEIVKKME